MSSSAVGPRCPGQSVGMDAQRTPKEVVRRFLDHGRTVDDGWDMDVIMECFSERYWSHTWQGDLATTGARQGAFFGGFDFLERLSSDLIAEDDLVVHRSTVKLRHRGEAFGIRSRPGRWCRRRSPRQPRCCST